MRRQCDQLRLRSTDLQLQRYLLDVKVSEHSLFCSKQQRKWEISSSFHPDSVGIFHGTLAWFSKDNLLRTRNSSHKTASCQETFPSLNHIKQRSAWSRSASSLTKNDTCIWALNIQPSVIWKKKTYFEYMLLFILHVKGQINNHWEEQNRPTACALLHHTLPKQSWAHSCGPPEN